MSEFKVEAFLSEDKPVSHENEDSFNRYPYAIKIANLINASGKTQSIVAAIYAEWGKGKTSLLNFIKEELLKKDNIIVVEFNPWLFKGEEQLILSFFKILAEATNGKIKSNKENVTQLFSAYAGALGGLITMAGVPGAGKVIGAIAKLWKAKPLEHYRDRIDKMLSKSEKKIVVLIDDIDRLTVSEVQATFKLVKLVADFSNTSYILSFDNKMVAKSLDPMFVGGGVKYLEKIIQLPIKLPEASKKYIRSYTFKIIESAISSLKVEIPEKENKRFEDIFVENLLPFIDSPRFALRYSNSIILSFSILKDLVNTTDLLIIEALKVLYPQTYDFIKANHEGLLGIYDSFLNPYKFGKDEDYIKNELEEHLIKYSNDESKAIRAILIALFDPLRNAIGPGKVSFPDHIIQKWYLEKRICSRDYFNRYFTYSLDEDDISDIQFSSLIKELCSKDYLLEVDILRKKFEQFDFFSFTQKLHRHLEDLSVNEKKTIAINLGLTPNFSFDETTANELFSYYHHLYSVLSKSIISQKEQPDLLEFVTDLFSRIKPINSKIELLIRTTHFYENERSENPALSLQIIHSLENLVSGQIFSEYSIVDILNNIPDNNFQYILRIRSREKPSEVKQGLTNLIVNNRSKFLDLLFAFSPNVFSSGESNSYKEPITEKGIRIIGEIIDLNLLYDESVKHFGELPKLTIERGRDKRTTKELVAHFQFEYRKIASNK